MDSIDSQFVELYREMGRQMGLPDLFSTIFARIYIEPEDIAMDQLAKETGYSLASISNSLRMLESMFPIKRIKKPGSKKIYLSMEKDIVKIMREHLLKKEAYCLNTMKEKLPGIIEEHRKKARTENEKRKLKILEDYYKKNMQIGKIIQDVIRQMEKI